MMSIPNNVASGITTPAILPVSTASPNSTAQNYLNDPPPRAFALHKRLYQKDAN
jgi:hypothetical protein